MLLIYVAKNRNEIEMCDFGGSAFDYSGLFKIHYVYSCLPDSERGINHTLRVVRLA